MRRLSFDSYEFDVPESEESLDLAISSLQQHQDLAPFLADCDASAQVGSAPPEGWPRWAEVVKSVRRYAGLELPPAETCRVVVLSDDWDDLEVAVAAESLLVWYHWWTTA